jgi:hypothetical protein
VLVLGHQLGRRLRRNGHLQRNEPPQTREPTAMALGQIRSKPTTNEEWALTLYWCRDFRSSSTGRPRKRLALTTHGVPAAPFPGRGGRGCRAPQTPSTAARRAPPRGVARLGSDRRAGSGRRASARRSRARCGSPPQRRSGSHRLARCRRSPAPDRPTGWLGGRRGALCYGESSPWAQLLSRARRTAGVLLRTFLFLLRGVLLRTWKREKGMWRRQSVQHAHGNFPKNVI